MIPVKFPGHNRVIAKNQDEYEPLPAHVDKDGNIVTCCFRLGPGELEEIARTKTLWIQQMTFGKPFQPIALSTQEPETMK